MIILGLDPGSRYTGYGLIQKKGSQIFHVDNGVIITTDKLTLPERLLVISEKLSEIIAKYQPVSAAIENIFYSKNVLSALKLGHARGVALLECAKHKLKVEEYPPTTIKKAVAGSGHADKLQIQKMVTLLLKLPQSPEENAADALAVAICHGNSIPMQIARA